MKSEKLAAQDSKLNSNSSNKAGKQKQPDERKYKLVAEERVQGAGVNQPETDKQGQQANNSSKKDIDAIRHPEEQVPHPNEHSK
jgi:hypothetical protein